MIQSESLPEDGMGVISERPSVNSADSVLEEPQEFQRNTTASALADSTIGDTVVTNRAADNCTAINDDASINDCTTINEYTTVLTPNPSEHRVGTRLPRSQFS